MLAFRSESALACRLVTDHDLPGLFGRAKPCLAVSFGRNSSSSVDAVISDGVDSSNLTVLSEFSLSFEGHLLFEDLPSS